MPHEAAEVGDPTHTHTHSAGKAGDDIQFSMCVYCCQSLCIAFLVSWQLASDIILWQKAHISSMLDDRDQRSFDRCSPTLTAVIHASRSVLG